MIVPLELLCHVMGSVCRAVVNDDDFDGFVRLRERASDGAC